MLCPLYPILDAAFMPAHSAQRAVWLQQTLLSLAQAGVTLLQLREKNQPAARIAEDAATLRCAAPPGMRLILNDDPRLARAVGFDGVHLGQGDATVADARAILGPEAIIGLSTHTPLQLQEADQTGATYLAIGPVFATATKPDAEPVVALEGVRAARALTRKPLVAIGGITTERAAAVRAAGADAVAVIGALFGDPRRSPGELAQDFLRCLR